MGWLLLGRDCLCPKEDEMWPSAVEQEKVWIEFITSNGAYLQPLPVRAVVMLTLRSCLTWALLHWCSAYIFSKGNMDFYFYFFSH